MLFGLCTISANTWLRVRIDTRDHSKISERPPACCASATMVPLNAVEFSGRRMMIRVLYGAPAAVPERKYSSVTYGKSSTFTAVGTMLTAGFGYIAPGDVTGPETVGIGVVAASVLFGAIHIGSRNLIGYGIWAACIGAIMGWLTVATEGLTAAVVAHGLYDVLALAYVRFGVDKG